MALRADKARSRTGHASLPHLDDFLLFIQANNYSNNTLLNYERDLRTFESFLNGELGGLPFPSISKRTIEQYKAYLHSKDRKTASGAVAEVSLDAGSINRGLSSL